MFFASEAAAKETHDKMQNKVVDGRTLVVLFAKKTSHTPGSEKRKQPATGTDRITTAGTMNRSTKPERYPGNWVFREG